MFKRCYSLLSSIPSGNTQNIQELLEQKIYNWLGVIKASATIPNQDHASPRCVVICSPLFVTFQIILLLKAAIWHFNLSQASLLNPSGKTLPLLTLIYHYIVYAWGLKRIVEKNRDCNIVPFPKAIAFGTYSCQPCSWVLEIGNSSKRLSCARQC